MHVCMYACMRVCMYACMHVCMYARMHVCMYACMHVCTYACMHVCTVCCLCVTYACMHARMCVCMCVCERIVQRIESANVLETGVCEKRFLTTLLARALVTLPPRVNVGVGCVSGGSPACEKRFHPCTVAWVQPRVQHWHKGEGLKQHWQTSI